jgi:DNA-binding CsgD family transcriptional regulator
MKEYIAVEIAHKLRISPKTVEQHKRNLIQKTDSKILLG